MSILECRTHRHAFSAHIQAHERDEALTEQLPYDLAHAAKPSNDDMPLELLAGVLPRLQGLVPTTLSQSAS